MTSLVDLSPRRVVAHATTSAAAITSGYARHVARSCRIARLVSRIAVTLALFVDLLTALAPIALQPIELWLHILEQETTPCARHHMVLMFSGVCCHARSMVWGLIAPSATLFSRQFFMLDINLQRLRKKNAESPFDHTKRVRVLAPVRDFEPLPRILQRSFATVASVELVLGPVTRPPSDSTWQEFRGALTQLSVLHGLRTLVHLSLYLFVDHDYRREEVDLGELRFVAFMESLQSLALRIAGGADIFADKDFLLPPALQRLRVSVEVLNIIDRRAWSSATTRFNALEIEDTRSRYHLRRPHYRDAAKDLSSAMGPALPGWMATLRSLALVDVTLDYTGIRALSNLVRLTRLDLHPAGLELTPQESALLEGDCPVQQRPATSAVRLHLSGLGPYAGVVSVPHWSHQSVLATPLKHLLSRLSDLRVLHLGMTKDILSHGSSTAVGAQTQHLSLFTTLDRHILPSLSYWHFGLRSRDDPAQNIYLHLPTCGTCATLKPGGRSWACRAYELSLERAPDSVAGEWSAQEISDKLQFENE